jgi:Ca-activated chloride channel family protein
MTQWGTPFALALVLPVLLLVFRRRWVSRHRLPVARVASLRRDVTMRQRVAWLPSLLQIVGLVCLCLALARPQSTRVDTVVDSEGLDILLAIDTSGSMSEGDLSLGRVRGDRLTIARTVVEEFIAKRPHDRIGVVVFGEEAFTLSPLTLDHQTLGQMMGGVQIGIAGAQGTAIGTALAVSSKRLKDLDAPSRLVILLTDGHNNAGRVQPVEAAEAAAALGIRVYTIGVGAQKTGLRRLLSGGDGLDEESLRNIASITDGQFFHATSGETLRQIYETIDTLEPSPAEVRQLVDRQEQFRMFAVPGTALMWLSVLLGTTWLRRGP